MWRTPAVRLTAPLAARRPPSAAAGISQIPTRRTASTLIRVTDSTTGPGTRVKNDTKAITARPTTGRVQTAQMYAATVASAMPVAG